ncbi:M15 family metallopeptidase [Gaiella sp.]|uniref:M15 family metallopeptidase n=1 Tax=Gaiella sp. TaxID=2663207 RepID=UPI0032635297
MAFKGSIAPISPALAHQMTGVSWRPGCPVPLRDLRVVTVTHRGFEGRDRIGRVIVHRDVAARILGTLRRLYVDDFPIRRMVPIDAYGGNDFRSIEADNTSAFNCRFVDGTTRYSEHAYGRAIDVNPIENPYVTRSGATSHPASRPYLRRTRFRPGMAVEGHALVRAFDGIGWGWGGRWSGVKDYQHFSARGR